jgi:hypothetical protein
VEPLRFIKCNEGEAKKILSHAIPRKIIRSKYNVHFPGHKDWKGGAAIRAISTLHDFGALPIVVSS